ncbi:MAG: spermine synthase [Okeania sp. SIO2G4]|uniref:spermidine synthase n=1 Tax=unclassified Okeania TaxID=2634635 RepID=UPI0013BE57FA|nr:MULTISPECIES: fused MFS/spermidine synthase [unclassified Okeania]NEP07103.1 spermine synthase [Okeania sp. SIO4D6]NEP39718.1 spermine synthase [Okeania sp. SIO2H7]NEP73779.1 spermine synthase [Okeania sp. SIO2G5]NEP94437.1 spermine synthase [Okeania sp. SIO2F5]NEQ92305.1 spermine synthase [Okeania sp. SIO2G4]
MNNQKYWQTKNLEAIKQRISWVYEQPDGIIFSQPSGIHFLTIKKIKFIIQLVLVEQVTLKMNWVQSILNLDNPTYLIFPYTQAMMLALVWNSQPQKIYIAGFGGGSIPQVFHHYFPDTIIECAEVDASILSIAQKFFGVELNDRLKVKIQDGREYLEQQDRDNLYDIMMIDVAFGNGYMSYNLATKEFYELCDRHLSKSGVIVVNTLKSNDFEAEYIKTIKTVFPSIYICHTSGKNTIIIGTRSYPVNKAEIREKAQFIQDYHQFSFPLVDRANEIKMIDELSNLNLDQVSILQDTASPANYFDSWLF